MTLINELSSGRNKVPVCNLVMSQRLRNILCKINVEDLLELSNYSEKEIMELRNLGQVTFRELKNLCMENNIKFLPDITFDAWRNYYIIPRSFMLKCAKREIRNPEDLQKIDTSTLYQLCDYDYYLTCKLYYKLRKKGIIVKKSPDPYLFEIFSEGCVYYLYQSLGIVKVSQFLSTDQKKLLSVRNLGMKKLQKMEELARNSLSLPLADTENT